MLTNYVACTLLFVAVAAFPPQYQQIANPRPPYDVSQLDDVTEESNPLEVLLYRTVLQQLVDDIMDEKEQQAAVPTQAPERVEPENDQKERSSVLQELQALEKIVEGNQGGRWLDQIQDVSKLLPPNYHNATEQEFHEGNVDLDVKQNINKQTNGNTESLWLSEVVEAKPDQRGPDFGCSLVNPCGRDEYCYETSDMSECRTCHVVGSRCIDNAQCCMPGGAETYCVLGVCMRDVTRGSPGTFCDSIDDCGEGLCCSQQAGLPRRVCKPFAKLGQQCSRLVHLTRDVVMLGDNEFFCPCVKGLSCSDGGERSISNVETANEGTFCQLPVENEPQWVKQANDLTPGGNSAEDIFDTMRQARFESEDDQRYDELLPLVHKDSKKSMEAHGPMM